MAATPQMTLTEEQVHRLADQLAPHSFPHIATALRQAMHSILGRWRSQTMKVLPHLDEMSIKEFEDAIAIILKAVAEAMEAEDPMAVRSLLDKAPEHGYDRFLQKYTPHDLFTEERILRKVIIVELDNQMGRPATKEEAAALHDLLDLMGEFALLSLYGKRAEEARESAGRAARNERLAALGTLALGVGHDLANLLLPLRIHLEIVQQAPLPAEEREHLQIIERIAKAMQNLSANLRYLEADPVRSEHQQQTTDLNAWISEFEQFFRPIIDGPFAITCDVPENLPPAAIRPPVLSQAIFNLIKNAAKAVRDQPDGKIVLSARARSDGGVRLIVVDNGPGMSPEVRKHCFDPFYTTGVRGTTTGAGLGLALVHALFTKAGAEIKIHSPPPSEVTPPPEVPKETPEELANGIEGGEQRGTAFIIDLPPHLN